MIFEYFLGGFIICFILILVDIIYSKRKQKKQRDNIYKRLREITNNN